MTSNRSTSGGSLVGTTMPVKPGQKEKWDGRIGDPKNPIYNIKAECQIVELKPGECGVKVHDSIYIDALKKNVTFDRVLSFLPEGRDPQGEIITPDPNGNGWTKVDRNIYTAAYFIDPAATIRD